MAAQRSSLCHFPLSSFLFFFFNDTATTEIYTLFLHDALPISYLPGTVTLDVYGHEVELLPRTLVRSEEHTSELQSPYVNSYAVFCLKTDRFRAVISLWQRSFDLPNATQPLADP